MSTNFIFSFIFLAFLSLAGYSQDGAGNFMVVEKKRFSRLNFALITNESSVNLPKFELDFWCCNSDMKASKDGIWLSVTTARSEIMDNGLYKFSSKNINSRDALTFSGALLNNGAKTSSISGGFFTLLIKGTDLIVDYELLLQDGSKITGKYAGNYESDDWRWKLSEKK